MVIQNLDDQPLDLSVQPRASSSQNIRMSRRMSGQNGQNLRYDEHQVQEGSLGSSSTGGSVTGSVSERRNEVDSNQAYMAYHFLNQAYNKAKVYSQIRNSKRRNSALGIESVRYKLK